MGIVDSNAKAHIVCKLSIVVVLCVLLAVSVSAICGDGVWDYNEQCDDKNPINTDGCFDTCQLDATCPYSNYPVILRVETVPNPADLRGNPGDLCPAGFFYQSAAAVIYNEVLPTRPDHVARVSVCVNPLSPGEVSLGAVGYGLNAATDLQTIADCTTNPGHVLIDSVVTYGDADDLEGSNAIELFICSDNPTYPFRFASVQVDWQNEQIAKGTVECPVDFRTGVTDFECTSYREGGSYGDTCVAAVQNCHATPCANCGNGVLDIGEECDIAITPSICDAQCQFISDEIAVTAAQICDGQIICGADDSVCPEDFTDLSGAQISCGNVVDVDCQRGDITALFQNDPGAPSLISYAQTSNPNAAIVGTSETVQNNNYVSTVTVEGPSGSTVTEIEYNEDYPGIPAIVLFDNQALLTCDVSPSPCFTFEEHPDDTATLSVYHDLSVHVIQAIFELASFSMLPYLVLFAVVMLLPVFIIAAKRSQYLDDIEMYTGQLEHHVHVPHNQLHKLHNYIQRKIKAGKDREEIRGELLEIGWEPHVVDLVMHQHHQPHKDIGRLKIYIHKMEEKGHDQQEVRELLKERGWDDETIDEAFKQ